MSNMFAESATVGQLFDALWYHATSTADERTKHTMMGDGENDPEVTFRKAREVAIGQAHQRYEEITNGNG